MMGSLGVCNFIDMAGRTCLQKSAKATPLQYAPLRRFRISSKLSESVDNSEASNSSVKSSYRIENLSEIESLVSEICDTDSIAEVELKLGTFELSVTRDLSGKAESRSPRADVPSPPPATVNVLDTYASNGPVSTSTSLAVSGQAPSSSGIRPFLDRAVDEGFVIVKSPRVGTFQRSRTTKKKKRGPDACKEKQIVREGQVLCYIHQLGGELPVQVRFFAASSFYCRNSGWLLSLSCSSSSRLMSLVR
ncbi:hypothetical protein LINGRAHAP2_LOCUS12413 [Linum grandiflorum]